MQASHAGLTTPPRTLMGENVCDFLGGALSTASVTCSNSIGPPIEASLSPRLQDCLVYRKVSRTITAAMIITALQGCLRAKDSI